MHAATNTVTTTVTDPQPTGLAGFSREGVEALSRHKGEPDWVREARLAAWAIYEGLPFPKRSDEEWRRTDTYPYMEIEEERVSIGHEATVSKVAEEQIFYLMSRGLNEAEAMSMIVNGFIEPIAKELPLEYAVELNRLIQLEMEGSVG